MNILCYFRGNNWQYLLPVTKFEHESKNEDFGNPVFAIGSWTPFQILHDFSDEIGGDIKECDGLIV